MPRPAARAYLLTAALDTAALDTALAGAGRARWVTKPALMPLLAAAAGPGAGPAVRVALVGSWLGDVALLGRGERALLGGVGGFAVAHAGWLAAITAARPAGPATRADVASGAAFTAGCAAAVRAVLPRLPDPALRAPVAGYAALVCAMGHAAVSTGARLGGARGQRLAAGAALFVVSDALVALSRFGGRRRPLVDAAVMATYSAAQALLVSALAGAQPAYTPSPLPTRRGEGSEGSFTTVTPAAPSSR